MKKYVLAALLSLIITHVLHAQKVLINLNDSPRPKSVFAINAGYLNPKGTEAGMMIGGVLSTAIDEAVNIGFGFDIFHKTYSEHSEVAGENNDKGLTTSIDTLLVEYSRTVIPLMLALNIKIPAIKLYENRNLFFGYFVHAGIGYEFLISKERNYDPDINTNQTRKFGGLGWQGAAGIFYDVGSRSTVTATVLYNSSEVSRDITESKKGLPITERVNLSGLGLRLGVMMKFF